MRKPYTIHRVGKHLQCEVINSRVGVVLDEYDGWHGVENRASIYSNLVEAKKKPSHSVAYWIRLNK
jgi:hypothetical protein